MTCNTANIDKIQRLQNRAARILFKNYDYVNTREINLVNNLNVMTLDERRHFRVCCLMFKCMHGLVPNYLSDRVLMQFDMHEYSTRSSFNNDMYLPVPNTDAFENIVLLWC
jgi:hypothetical protein